MIATQLRQWTVEEYHRMIEVGILSDGDRVELLDGQIITMTPQQPIHSGTTQRSDKYLKHRFEGLADVRVQLPIELLTSEPESDIAIVRIVTDDYGTAHPTVADIFLLIEIAQSSLDLDRTTKALIYAKAGIEEYWILDVKKRQTHVLRQPTDRGYQSEFILPITETVAPMAFSAIAIPLSKLFLP